MKTVNTCYVIVFIVLISGCLKFKENLIDPSTLMGFLITNCLPYPKKLCPFQIIEQNNNQNQNNNENNIIFVPAIGELNPTFGSGGIGTIDIDSGYDQANAIAIQPDGKIVVTGFTHNGSNYYFVVVRYK